MLLKNMVEFLKVFNILLNMVMFTLSHRMPGHPHHRVRAQYMNVN